ncbi:hypothetical protein GGR54DRAFT_594598 [Hypoxylon sp. NC1633]|nr:hypothetical protein GGR54DRAFT_594598 [Hypoxylon sp. NC1633]
MRSCQSHLGTHHEIFPPTHPPFFSFAMVELLTPNVTADQLEIFLKSISDGEKVCVSLDVHNVRDCVVATAELDSWPEQIASRVVS